MKHNDNVETRNIERQPKLELWKKRDRTLKQIEQKQRGPGHTKKYGHMRKREARRYNKNKSTQGPPIENYVDTAEDWLDTKSLETTENKTRNTRSAGNLSIKSQKKRGGGYISAVGEGRGEGPTLPEKQYQQNTTSKNKKKRRKEERKGERRIKLHMAGPEG